MTEITFGQFAKLNRDVLVKNMARAGIYFVSAQRKYLNVSQLYRRTKKGGHRGLNPSKPGEFPKKLSGQLQRSLTWNLDPVKLVLTVGSNMKGYPSFLQFGTKWLQPRPWLTLSWNLEQANIGRIIVGGKA